MHHSFEPLFIKSVRVLIDQVLVNGKRTLKRKQNCSVLVSAQDSGKILFYIQANSARKFNHVFLGREDILSH